PSGADEPPAPIPAEPPAPPPLPPVSPLPPLPPPPVPPPPLPPVSPVSPSPPVSVPPVPRLAFGWALVQPATASPRASGAEAAGRVVRAEAGQRPASVLRVDPSVVSMAAR